MVSNFDSKTVGNFRGWIWLNWHPGTHLRFLASIIQKQPKKYKWLVETRFLKIHDCKWGYQTGSFTGSLIGNFTGYLQKVSNEF